FFVGQLKVETPSLATFIEELKELLRSDKNASIEEVKEHIRNINRYAPMTKDIEGFDLESLEFLPSRNPDGGVTLVNPSSDFAIVDRIEYGNAFKDKVSILDFTLEESHTLRPFLSALGLENRFMSLNVEESSTVLG